MSAGAPSSNPQSILVDARKGATLLDVSERQYHELRKRPEFPAPKILGPRCVRWVRAELESFALTLHDVRDRYGPEQLRRARSVFDLGASLDVEAGQRRKKVGTTTVPRKIADQFAIESN